MRILTAVMYRFALVTAIATVAGPAMADCASVLKFDKSPQIRIEDLARLGRDEFKDAGDNYYVRILFFRASERPQKAGWRALGIVYAGESGISDSELGGILWTTKPEQFGDRPLRLEGTSQTARAVAAPRSPLGACPNGFSIEVNADGEVTLDGVKWGRVAP